MKVKRRVRFGDYYFSARVAGIRSPQLQLRKAEKNGSAKKISWGLYEMKIDLPPSWARRLIKARKARR
jgi:hypothetical protein